LVDADEKFGILSFIPLTHIPKQINGTHNDLPSLPGVFFDPVGLQTDPPPCFAASALAICRP
jgi:hypothetical protein